MEGQWPEIHWATWVPPDTDVIQGSRSQNESEAKHKWSLWITDNHFIYTPGTSKIEEEDTLTYKPKYIIRQAHPIGR